MFMAFKIPAQGGAAAFRTASSNGGVYATDRWGPRRFSFTCYWGRRSYGRRCPAPRKRAPLRPWRSAPLKRFAPLARALPAGKTRTRTNPAKSCSPGNVWSRRIPAPASAWLGARTSPRVGLAPHAVFPWPRAPSTPPTAPLQTCQPLLTYPRLCSANRRLTSHLWDFSTIRARHPASHFLYARSDEIMK